MTNIFVRRFANLAAFSSEKAEALAQASSDVREVAREWSLNLGRRQVRLSLGR